MITTSGRVVRKTGGGVTAKAIPQKQSPAEYLEEALQSRDFSKATTILDFFKASGQSIGDLQINPWLAYSAFHMNDIGKAIDVYKELLVQQDCDPIYHVYLGCCYFVNGAFEEAEEAANRGPDCPLKTRLLFHVAQKQFDEQKVMQYHEKLMSSVEDNLTLAAAQYSRNHFQEAVDVYKKVLAQTKDYHALNVYVSMCYYKMDYYEVSLDVLNLYLHIYPNSAIAINLKACNHYRLYNGQAAETELKVLIDLHRATYNIETDIVKHNLVVFRNGEDALQVLPPMVDVGIPEARLNLVIYHLRHEQIDEAYELIKDVQPITSQEYILKAVVSAYIGQKTDSQEHLKACRDYFHFVGSAQSECDTIPGRQCMASFFFLMHDFANVLVYLRSIKAYFPKDDTFLYLYGISCAGTGNFAEAVESLLAVRSEKIKSEFSYTSWLVRSHIMNRHANKAWDIYLKMETGESIGILRLMANECFKTSAFFFAAKAFDVLERLDNDPEYIQGKKSSCIGVFQQVFANVASADLLFDVMKMLEASIQQHADEPPVVAEFNAILSTIKDWVKESKIKKR